MARKNLIIIHRGDGQERDFEEIAEKVFALDEDITTYLLSNNSSEPLPASAWNAPVLVVALSGKSRLPIQRGFVLKSQPISKLVQAKRASAAGVRTPPMAAFRFGMKLDPIIFGSHVILKPMTITSKGRGVQLFRRQRAEQLRGADFPADHPIHQDRHGYLVQRFIDTGAHPNWNRVISFLGEPIYTVFGSLLEARPPLDSSDDVLAAAKVAIQGSERQRIWRVEDDVIAAARAIGKAFDDVPLLAIDFLREEKSGLLYFLECNPGGNTWHFTSNQPGGINLRMELGEAHINGVARAHVLGRERMIAQFGAWDICARALVNKVHELAC